MRIIPYLKKEYKTDLTPEEIIEKLKEIAFPADRKLAIDKIVQNDILEVIISNHSFSIVRGRYGLTYGKRSLLPIVKGRLFRDEKTQKTIVRVIIRPFMTGMLILTPFYYIAIYGMVQGLIRMDLKSILFYLIFIGLTYGSIMWKYNKEANRYLEFLKDQIS